MAAIEICNVNDASTVSYSMIVKEQYVYRVVIFSTGIRWT